MIQQQAYTFQFPNIAIPDDQKDEEYHKRYLLAILNQTVVGGYVPDLYYGMERSMQFYNSNYEIGDKYDFLQKDAMGRSMPAKWIVYNNIRNKLSLLEGEVAVQKIDVSCKTINRDAMSRKMRKKAEILAEKIMADAMQEIDPEQDIIGNIKPKYVPYTEEELDVYMQSSYKEPIEKAVDGILRYEVERGHYASTRTALFRDVLITGRCVSRVEYRDNRPHIRRVDPRYVIVDPFVQDDNFSTAGFIGEWNYIPLATAGGKYNLNNEELDSIRRGQDNILWMGYTTGGNEFLTPYSIINGQDMALVFYAEWRDVKRVVAKVTKDQYGNDHVKILGAGDKRTLTAKEKEAGAKIEERTVETIRKATLVGGKYLKDWGELENIIRTEEGMGKAEFTYSVVAPQYVNNQNLSKAQELQALQEFKDLIMYTIQLEMSTAGKKGFIYDIRFKPDTLSLQDVMYYLKTAGIVFANSGSEEIPVTGNMFPTIDNSLTQAINYYMNLAAYVDSQMAQVSGINDARQGFQKSEQLVGVTQMAMMQSSLITQPINKAFEVFENITWQKFANYIKTIFPFIKDQYEPIISTIGVDVMDEDGDISLQTYGIFVQVNGNDMMGDRSKFEQMVMLSIQAGQLPIHEGLVLLYEPDTKTAIKKYMAIKEREAQQQQAMMQQQAQMQQQGEQAKIAAATESQIVVDRERTANKMEQQQQREALKQNTMGVKAEIDAFMKEKEQEFQAFIEALKERD